MCTPRNTKDGLWRLETSFSGSGNNCRSAVSNSEAGVAGGAHLPLYSPRVEHIVDISVTYGSMPNSETGQGRRGTLCAACLPLSLILPKIGRRAEN